MPYHYQRRGDRFEQDALEEALGRTPTPTADPFDVTGVQNAYKHYLGRDASESELASHRGNPGGAMGTIGTIVTSPEAKAFSDRPPVAQTASGVSGAFDAATAALPTRGGATLTGFPTDLGRSMKHVFGAIASNYGNDRSRIGDIVTDPQFTQWFPNARLVDDDEIDFGGQLSDFTGGSPVGLVDVFRGGDDALQWIDQAYNQGGGGGGPSGGGGLSPDLIAALTGLGDSGGTLAEIQAELDAIINGRPSPTSQGVLQSRLGGG